MTELPHHARKRFLKPVEIGFRCLRFDVEHQVEAARIGTAKFMLPQNLSEPSFAAIANHRAAYFPRSGDSISALAGFVPKKESRKEGSMNFLTPLINPAKLLAVAQHLHQFNNGQ